MREFAVGAQGALDIHEQGLLNYGGLGCGRGPDQAIRTYRGPGGAWQETGTEPEQTREQGLLNYGGLSCGRGPDQAIRTYRGPEALGRKPEQNQSRLAIRRSRTTGAARELQGPRRKPEQNQSRRLAFPFKAAPCGGEESFGLNGERLVLCLVVVLVCRLIFEIAGPDENVVLHLKRALSRPDHHDVFTVLQFVDGAAILSEVPGFLPCPGGDIFFKDDVIWSDENGFSVGDFVAIVA